MAQNVGSSLKSRTLSPARKTKPKRGAADKLQSLVASAMYMSRLPTTSIKGNPRPEGWQADIWDFFNAVGEFRSACSWVGNLLSKANLYVTYDGKPIVFNDESNAVEGDPNGSRAYEYMRALYGGPEYQGEMLRQMGIHFTATGECYLLGETKMESGKERDRWQVFSGLELRRQSQTIWKSAEDEFESPFVARLWRPHPRYSHLSDSPSRSVLPILAIIDGLTKHQAATIDSRLASAGILVLPDTITFGAAMQTMQTAPNAPGDPDTGEDDEATATPLDQDANGFAALLGKVAALSLADRGNAASVVPIILQVPEEAVDKVQFLDFWSKFDEKMDELEKAAVHRLALGMDMPPETLEGTGDSNHWASWQIEDSAIKIHSEPLLAVITNTLTEGYLQSLLLEDDMDWAEVRRYGIAADTKDMRLKPNRSKEAIELWNERALSTAKMLEENGFDPKDEMGDVERSKWLAIDVAGGSTTPELVESALRSLQVALGTVKPAQDGTEEARPPSTLEDHPVRSTPDTRDDEIALAASILTMRALERAGNRLRTTLSAKIPGVSAMDTYRYVPGGIKTKDLDGLLTDAWTWCPVIAAQVGADPEKFQAAVDAYARALLIQGAEPNLETLRTYLAPLAGAA